MEILQWMADNAVGLTVLLSAVVGLIVVIGKLISRFTATTKDDEFFDELDKARPELTKVTDAAEELKEAADKLKKKETPK